MRRGVTVLVVVVVAAIALAAGVDALRDDSEAEPAARGESEPQTTSTTPEATASPAAAELGGTLYYTDASCELKAIELPGQTPAEAPNWDECRFVLSPNGRRVSGAGSGWDPTADPVVGRLFELEDGLIQVSTDRGPEGEPFPGTAPAWRPDGTLTYFADGAVRTWPEGEIVLSQEDLRRTVEPQLRGQRHFELRRAAVRELTWLTATRVAAIVAAEGLNVLGVDAVAIFSDGHLVEAVGGGGRERLFDLQASPNGSYLSARFGVRGRFLLLDGEGRPLTAPSAEARAITFSPDERWVALAGENAVFLFRPGSREWTAEIELVANDIAWLGQAEPAALDGVDEVRDWLGGVGATGRLFVTVGPWTDCALRALHLPDLEWAEQPPGPPGPCRFTLDDQDGVHAENEAPQPGGGLVAVCRNHAVDVLDDEGFFGYPGACAPAWTPDGRLTFIRNGGLFDPKGRLLSRDEVSDFLGRPSALEEIAWVDDRRFWAVVRSGESAIVALMTTEGLVFSPSFTTQTIEGLRVSTTGMVAARTDQGVVLFDSGGRRALTFPAGQAVSWAPGELIAAVATPSEILFVAPVSREVVTVPLTVRDLEWVVP